MKVLHLIEDLTKLVDVLPNNAYANTETVERSASVEISEIELELAMLRATVNSLQDKHIPNQNNASTVQEQLPATGSMATPTQNDDSRLAIHRQALKTNSWTIDRTKSEV